MCQCASSFIFFRYQIFFEDLQISLVRPRSEPSWLVASALPHKKNDQNQNQTRELINRVQRFCFHEVFASKMDGVRYTTEYGGCTVLPDGFLLLFEVSRQVRPNAPKRKVPGSRRRDTKSEVGSGK